MSEPITGSQSLAQHSAASGNWYTPLEWWARIQQMGDVHTDPCSDDHSQVKCQRTCYAQGELSEWYGNVYCNPPGNPRGMPRKFFKRCVEHYAAYKFRRVHVIYLAYSLEQLAWMPDVLKEYDHPMSVCIPRKRIAFLNKKGDPQRSPTHSNAFCYFGSEHEKFRRVFPGLHLTRGTPLADYRVF